MPTYATHDIEASSFASAMSVLPPTSSASVHSNPSISIEPATGRIWTLRPNSSSVVKAYYSDDFGSTWNSETVWTPTTPSNQTTWRLIMKIGSNGNPVAAMRVNDSSGQRWRFFERTAVNTWTTRAVLNDTDPNNAGCRPYLFQHPTTTSTWVLVHTTLVSGTPHITVYQSTDSLVSFGAGTAVNTDTSGSFAAAFYGAMACAMDSTSKIHCMYIDTSAGPSCNLNYRTITAWASATPTVSSASTIQSSVTAGAFRQFDACVDNSDNVYLVYLVDSGAGTTYQLKFRRYTGTWGAAVTVNTNASVFPSIYIDDSGQPCVFAPTKGFGTNSTRYNPVFFQGSSNGASWDAGTKILDEAQEDYDFIALKMKSGQFALYFDDAADDWTALVSSDAVFTSASNYPKTVAQTLVISQVVTRGIGVERTADAIKTRVGLGGRQTIRIGSTIYTVAGDTGHTYVLNSTDLGVTWTSEQVAAYPSAAVALVQGAGSQPVLFLVREGTNEIRPFLRASGGGWTHKTDLGTGGTATCEGFQALYDGTNYHLIFGRRNSSTNRREVRHATSAALASWASTTLDSGGTAGEVASNDRGIAATMDQDGDIHVIFNGVNAGVYTLEYIKRTGSTWGTAEVIETYGAYRAIHLSISTDSNKKPHITGTDTVAGVQNCFYRNKTGSSWSAKEYVQTSSGDQTWPSIGFEDRQYPIIVFSWNQDGTVHRYVKKSGSWNHNAVASDSTATKTEQLYDGYRNSSITLAGSFIVFQSSVMLFVTSLIVYGDAAAASGSAVLTQQIKIAGRDKVTSTLSLSSVVSDPAHAYAKDVGPSIETAGFSQVVARLVNMARLPTNGLAFGQQVDVNFVNSAGDDTYVDGSFEWMSFEQIVHVEKTRVQSISHTINFSQVGPGLTRSEEVVTDLEFSQTILKQNIKTLTAAGTLSLSQIVGLVKSLNLGVTSALSFTQGALRIRAWVWNSTHWNPGWAAEYEADVTDFIIMGPTEAPTIEMTMPRPEFGDEDNLNWRSGAIRRNRSGQAKVFKVPVYEELKYKWGGLMRKRAHEFRNIIMSLVGNNMRIRDHNGVWRDVVIATSQVKSVQGGPENVEVSIEFQPKDKVA